MDSSNITSFLTVKRKKEKERETVGKDSLPFDWLYPSNAATVCPSGM
jgi:hypothetical protein